MTLEALVRVLAISWLVSAGSGMEDYLSSNYAAFTQGTAGIILTAFCLTALGNLVETIITRFRQDAEQDPLTGLLNRRGLERAATSFNPRHRPVSVVQCDLDHFKRINDSYGHATGDQALQMVAALIQDLAPANSAVARFGGEEFVLLLDDTTLNQAGMLAHRMRLALGGLAWKHLGIEGQVTASFGVAQWSQSDHALADALARADVALYLAKDAGRNLVFLESWRPFQPSLPRVVQSA
jgi:diguanylate cyclase (GGDEF)-like protein